jgi:hypothetical protein
LVKAFMSGQAAAGSDVRAMIAGDDRGRSSRAIIAGDDDLHMKRCFPHR